MLRLSASLALLAGLLVSCATQASLPVVEPPQLSPATITAQAASTSSLHLVPHCQIHDSIRVHLWIYQDLHIDRRCVVGGQMLIKKGYYRHTREIEFTDHLLQVKQGRPIKVRRIFHKAQRHRWQYTLDGSPVSNTVENMVWHGQTVVLSQKPGHVQLVGASERQVPETEQERLLLDRVSFADFLPQHLVKIGDSWQVPPACSVYLFEKKEMPGGSYEGYIQVTLAEQVRYNQQPAVRLHLKTNYVYKQDVQNTGISCRQWITLEGDLYYALEQGRALQLELQGPVKTQWIEPLRPTPYAVEALGRMQVRMRLGSQKSNG